MPFNRTYLKLEVSVRNYFKNGPQQLTSLNSCKFFILLAFFKVPHPCPHLELGRDYLAHACIQPPCLHLSLAHTHPIQGACVTFRQVLYCLGYGWSSELLNRLILQAY